MSKLDLIAWSRILSGLRKMDCRAILTSLDINHIISVLYLQNHLDDETALDLIDRCNNELNRCTAESRGEVYELSERDLELRRQLTRQLYFRNRPKRPQHTAQDTSGPMDERCSGLGCG